MPSTPATNTPDPARQREAALREILDLIGRSREDAGPVFDAIVHRAAALCDAFAADLVLANAGDAHQRIVASYGTDPATVAVYDRGEVSMDPDVSYAARAIRTGRVVHVDDMMETEGYRRGVGILVSVVRDSGIRTEMFVPLVTATGAIGCIIIFRKEVRPFTPDEIALAETFAAQAVIAIENVRQFRELQTRLAREKASSEILQVISQSRDDDAPVFDMIAQRAAGLCGAAVCTFWRVKNGFIHYCASHGLDSDSFAETRLTPSIPLLDSTLTGQVVKTRAVVRIEDATAESYLDHKWARRQGLRQLIGVPILIGDEVWGSINLMWPTDRVPGEADIQLVETFAAQASIAIENVRQFRELQTRLAREAATREILEVISQSRDDEGPVFEAILRRAADLCGANAAALVLGKAGDSVQRLAGQYGMAPGTIAVYERGEVSMNPDISLAAQAILTGKAVHIADMIDTEGYRSGVGHYVSAVRDTGVRTNLFVPLVTPDGGIGCFIIFRKEVRPYTADEIALVETFASQAVIAIENVRQFRELQTRLEREAATRNILRVISESPDDEQPTFEAILDSATRLCGTPYASLVLGRKGDASQRMVAHRGAMAETLAFFRDGRVPMDPEDSIGARAILEGRTIHVPDMADTDQYRAGHERFRVLVDRQGPRSHLFVPLLGPDGGIGCFLLWKKEVAPFTADQIALIETFAAHAVIAIENVRQFRELQDRLAREEATRQILQVISQSRDDETPVFNAILERAERLCDAPSSALLLVDDARSHFVLVATRGMRSSTDIGEVHPITSGHTSSDAVLTGVIAHVPDVRDTELYRKGDPLRIELVEQWGLRTSLAVPLIRNDKAIGALTVMRLHRVRPFSDNDIRLLEAFAAQAVIAIENVRQFRALAALNAELGHRVQDQVGEIERMGRLKRFLPSAVADAVVSSGSERMLSSHRALLGVLFCDIRGFTAFCETAEPEETIEVLQTYHEEMGRLIEAHGAGVDHRMGDGIMVLFNDPLPCDDPAGAAVRLAMAMRDRMAELCAKWKKMGHRLGFGVGISLGYATVGMVGSGGRQDYTASGTAVNLAARLCDEALDGEILVSPRACTAVEGSYAVEGRGERTLKGIREPVELFRVTGVVAG